MRAAAVVALLGLLAGGGTARAQPLIADLSSHLIAVTAGFSGADVLLFGATQGRGDIAVVVQGPDEQVVVRRKSRVAGIWVNRERLEFERVPSLYYVAGNRPIEEMAPETVLARHRIGVANLRPQHLVKTDPDELAVFREALIRNKQAAGLYSLGQGRVTFLGGQLFRADVSFPANVPTGTYAVTVYLFQEGRIVGAQTTPLIVSKIGIGARLYDIAQQHAALYGIGAIAMALFAGWLAGAVFRKA